MRNRILLVYIAFLIALLIGCSSYHLTVTGDPQTPGTSLTQTQIIMVEVTPTTPSDTPNPPTETQDPVTNTPALISSFTPIEMATPTLADTPAPSMLVNLEAVGDIMLARTVGQKVLSEGPQVVFAGVQPVLDGADVLIGNLECAITSEGAPQPKSYTFAAPPETVKALALAGFDVLSLANNHAMDYGKVGLTDTINNLHQNGIASAGAGMNTSQAHQPVILERNGLRLAFLAYANVPVENSGFDSSSWIATFSQPGIAWAYPEQIKADVTAAKKEVDVVIVLLHSGYEITSIIPGISQDQRLAAHAAIDAGAALVIGSHPHFLQSIEPYRGGLIAYSLGNFVFDDYQGIANNTIILHVVLTRAGFQSYQWIPVQIKDGLPEMTDLDNSFAISTLIAPLSP